AGRMAVGPKHFILRLHHAGQRAHKHTALAGKIAPHLFFERGREKVAGPDADAQGKTTLTGIASEVLINGKARIYAGAGEEIAPHGSPRSFRSDHNHVDVLRRNYAGLAAMGD